MSQYNKLFTPKDIAVVFIDHQPQMTCGVASIDRATLINIYIHPMLDEAVQSAASASKLQSEPTLTAR